MNHTSRDSEHSTSETNNESGGTAFYTSGTDKLDHNGGRIGNLTSWLSRYSIVGEEPAGYETVGNLKICRFEMKDSWSQGTVKAEVVSTVDDSAFNDQTCNQLLQRARILQQCDHAHIQPLADYYLDDRQSFRWITAEPIGKPLWQTLDQSAADDASRIKLVSQFISVVAYFDLQAPHAVPAFEPQTFRMSAQSKLLVSDYQLEYLFQRGKTNPFHLVAEFMHRIFSGAAESQWRKQFLSIAGQLKETPLPQNLNTIAKLRARIKHLEETAELEQLREE